MVSNYVNLVFSIFVINYIVFSVGKSSVNEIRLANSDLPPQPLIDGVPPPPGARPPSSSSTAPVTPAPDRYAEENSKTIKISTTFPRRQSWESCLVRIAVVGKGIRDAFNGPCWIGGAFSINRDDLMIWGDPDKHPISLYSDTPGTMVVIINYVCTLKKYRFGNGKSIITRNKMSEEKCDEVLDTIYDHMKESNRIAVPETIKIGMKFTPDINYDKFTSTHSESVLDEECQKTISGKGRGIADSFDLPCNAIRDPSVIKFNEGMLIGNPMKDDFSWFSEAWSTSMEVRGGRCTLRRYDVENGFMKIGLSKISTEECTAAKKRMADKRSATIDGLKKLGEDLKHKIQSLLPSKLG